MCSIHEAWGSDFNKTFSSDEHFTCDSKNKYKEYLKLKKLFEGEEDEGFTSNNKVCQAVNTHIFSCKTCQAKFATDMYNMVTNKIRDNADTILLMLVVMLCVLLIKAILN